MLEHGGRLRRAADQYNIPLHQWLDLSTGINPLPWPVPPVPIAAWSRLPEEEDELVSMACRYYGVAGLLPVAGSQPAIQALPRLRTVGRVGVLAPAYAEHAHAWASAGHDLTLLPPDTIDGAVDELDVLVLVNPNNPTGHCFDTATLLGWHEQLVSRGGWLVVDEAFMDASPEQSLTAHAHLPGLIVLRSLGKFFGLAGARVGFVLAETGLLSQLADYLGPWTVTGPSRFVAARALADHDWHRETRERLKKDAGHLAELLTQCGFEPVGTPLFQWVRTPHAARLHQTLAEQGVFTRLFEQPSSLRFGLPCPNDFPRLEAALATGIATMVKEAL